MMSGPVKEENSMIRNKRQQRRDFLKKSLMTTLVLPVLGGFLRGGTSPNEKIGVGVVGCRRAGRGWAHVRMGHVNPLTEVRKIAEVDSNNVKDVSVRIEKEFKIKPPFIRDYRELLDDKSVDVVMIATPDHSHVLVTLDALKAGKDAYLEKPATFALDEGRWICRAARSAGRIVQVGTQARSSDGVQKGIKLLKQGRIGDVKLVHAIAYRNRDGIGPKGDYPIPAGVDYDLWMACAPYTNPKLTRKNLHYDWHWQRHYAGGEITNNGSHQLDVARWGLGLDRHPDTVLTYGTNFGFHEAGDTLRSGISILQYGDKTIVLEIRNLHQESIPKVGVHTATFFGTEGTFTQSSPDMAWYHHDGKGNLTEKITGDDYLDGAFVYGQAHFDNFITGVVNRKADELNADILDGHLSVSMCHLVKASWYLGENNTVSEKDGLAVLETLRGADDHPKRFRSFVDYLNVHGFTEKGARMSFGPLLTFDNEKERFVDNSAADALLSRSEYRSEFPVVPAERS